MERQGNEPTGTYASALGRPVLQVGKVRELYAWDDEQLLMVATDRISAFDYVLDSPVPDKGVLLNQLSLWWFDRLADLVPNHIRSTEVPDPVRGRGVICERLEMIPLECVARGYLTGSGWAEYRASGIVGGNRLPPGLQDGSRLPEPIFTPATKAPMGEHDENVDFAYVVRLLGAEIAKEIRELTVAVYTRGLASAQEQGLILADTKLEFGRRVDGTVVLADEVLTPDSSRFWDAETWRPGGRLEAFDKQFIRDWLLHESGWDRSSGEPPPTLPESVVSATRGRYVAAYERLTGRTFTP